jgi:vancomycin resistance protein YoaR
VWEAALALLVVAIVVTGLCTLFVMELWLADRILPGVYAWDVNLGALPRDQAIERLGDTFHYPSDRTPTLRFGDQTWPVQMADLGAEIDIAATVDAAMAIGHRGNLQTRLEEQLSTLVYGHLVMPTFTSDPGAGSRFLSDIARQVNRPLRNTTLSVNEDLSVEVVPGVTGFEVDEEATYLALAARISGMAGGDMELVIRKSEPLLADLSLAESQVRRILSGAVVLTAPGLDPRTIEPATLAGWLVLQPATDAAGTATLSVALGKDQLTSFASGIATDVHLEPTNAEFRFDEASGTLVPVVESVAGQTLDVTATVTLIEEAAHSDQRTVPLPLTPVRPALATEDAPKLGIVELLAQGNTSFAGSSASREQNIVVGAQQFDGLLIAPGETFSFNRYLGKVTAEKGYEQSIIIWGNSTRADVGGGLCQVSSTAFRAAFWAGLPITERWAHSFRVSYYEPPKGLDATIYSPTVDLKWVNDTGHHIMIHTHVDRAKKTLTFSFYGTNPGRTVEMDGPYEARPVPHGPAVYRDDPTLRKGKQKQIEWPKDGLDVTIYRIIKQDGEEVRRDEFFSRYRPWQAVYLVGTKEE